MTPRSLVLGFAIAFAMLFGPTAAHAWQHPVREFTVTARPCSFTPGAMNVERGDRVRINFVAEDAGRRWSFRLATVYPADLTGR